VMAVIANARASVILLSIVVLLMLNRINAFFFDTFAIALAVIFPPLTVFFQPASLAAEHLEDRIQSWADSQPAFRPQNLWRKLRCRMAEGVGFEPTIRFPAYTLSKRAP
jgi:hypothetical protein